jgi:hypothetical protein
MMQDPREVFSDGDTGQDEAGGKSQTATASPPNRTARGLPGDVLNSNGGLLRHSRSLSSKTWQQKAMEMHGYAFTFTIDPSI